MKASAVVVY